jgi:hypothetical protein
MVEENISILGLPTLQVDFIHYVIPRDKSAILQLRNVTVPTFATVKTMAECLGYLLPYGCPCWWLLLLGA